MAAKDTRRSDRTGKFVGAGKDGIAERRAKAHSLRLEGCAFREVGERLGISEAQAYKDFQFVHQKTISEANESAEESRQLQLEQLDIAIRGLMPKVRDGNPRAAEVMAKLQQEKAKLLGTYAPEKRTHDVGGTLADFLALGFEAGGAEDAGEVEE